MIFVAILSLLVFLEGKWAEQNANLGLDWWQKAVVYQVYPRSFKDTDGDGIGDLKGVKEKLHYLRDLGVDCVWLSPIFKSPMKDFGYDISDFEEIDPMFGTMKDFESLLESAKKLGMKVVLDFVPNHVSSEHEWFKKSVEKVDPYTDYFIWKTPVAGEKSPPNNWKSAFGNSAWEWNDKRQQYYLHQFAVQQPDLDFRNAAVRAEIEKVLTFWLDKGVDGFRMDSVCFLVEDATFPDEPLSGDETALENDYKYLKHVYTLDQEESYELVQSWRALMDKYSKLGGNTRFMMTEAYTSIENTIRYYGNHSHPGAHFPFNFAFVNNVTRETNARELAETIQLWYSFMPNGSWANFVMGNHDNSRPATRFGPDMVDSLMMLQMSLRGTPVVYNGDELGMEDTFVRWDQTVDPNGLNAGPKRYALFTRDPERSPYQWTDEENSGFTGGEGTWLPVNPNYWHLNAEKQLRDPSSHAALFKNLTKFRNSDVLATADIGIDAAKDSTWVLVVTRMYEEKSKSHHVITVVNLGSEMETVNLENVHCLPEEMTVVFSSRNSEHKSGDTFNKRNFKMRPKSAVILTEKNISAD